MNLNRLFDPRSVAVIGASNDPQKLGHAFLKNLLAGGKRRIYPVNPAAKKILGQLCFKQVSDIKPSVDLAVIAVPAPVVPEVLRDCGRKKIHFVIVISAGFKETGEAGRKKEEELKKIARANKIKIIGPNCLGLIDLWSKLNASFAADISKPGSVAFLSQSGAVGTAMLDWAKMENIGFSKFISVGNEAGLTENDFLEYLANDKNTKAILVYLEGLSDGRRFLRVAKKITAKKPLVVLKAGRTPRGAAAVLTHTGSLTSEEAVFEAACRQAGVISITSLRALFNFTKIFNARIFKPLRRLAIITNGGGPSIVMADLIDGSPTLELAELSEPVKKSLRTVLPAAAAVNNPVDLIGDALAERYEAALKILVRQKNIDGLVVILTPQQMTEPAKTARILQKYHRLKPILPMFIGEAKTAVGENLLKKFGLYNFEYPQDVAEVLEPMVLEHKKIKPTPQRSAGARLLDFAEAKQLLKKYGLETSGILLKNINELSGALKKITGSVVLKVSSPDVNHKSEVGGVKVNLRDLAQAKAAWQSIVRSVKAKIPAARIEGLILSPQYHGQEVLVGFKRDPAFGPVVVFGLGGIYTEVFADVAERVAPLTLTDVKKMLAEIKGYKLLSGWRGQPAINFPALAKVILAVAKLALANPQIKSLDLNPVIVGAKGAKIVDVRAVV